MRRAARDLVLGPPRRRAVDGADEVAWTVAGHDLAFASRDAPLDPAPEAVLGLFLEPALARRARLRFDGEVDASWRANAGRIVETWRGWWGYDGPDPLERLAIRPDPTPRAASVGACFSGGADSLWTLLRSPHRSEVLVFVHGYDIALGDEARMAAWEPHLRAVGAETGRRTVVLRTDLRRHPTFRAAPWSRTHGAALAAAGHVLAHDLGTLVVPSTWTPDFTQPWGSHPRTDGLWSSARLRVVHDDTEKKRWDKLWDLAQEPVAQRHLRVCWQNRAATGNCGRCEKCLRTRVTLHQVGGLESFANAFPHAPSLVEGLDALAPVSGYYVTEVWALIRAWALPPDVAAAVDRLLDRSARAQRPLGRLGTRLRKTWRKLTRLGRRRPR